MVCFCLGSNVGDRAAYLKNSLIMLEENFGRACKISSVYETEPWGVSKHDDYLNMVVTFETGLSPEKVFRITSSIEKKLGRKRRIGKIDPRTIDIDILFYNDLVINKNDLILPHPRMASRRFVLQPLTEIMEHFVHPVSGQTMAELFSQCTDNYLVVKTKINLFLH